MSATFKLLYITLLVVTMFLGIGYATSHWAELQATLSVLAAVPKWAAVVTVVVVGGGSIWAITKQRNAPPGP